MSMSIGGVSSYTTMAQLSSLSETTAVEEEITSTSSSISNCYDTCEISAEGRAAMEGNPPPPPPPPEGAEGVEGNQPPPPSESESTSETSSDEELLATLLAATEDDDEDTTATMLAELLSTIV